MRPTRFPMRTLRLAFDLPGGRRNGRAPPVVLDSIAGFKSADADTANWGTQSAGHGAGRIVQCQLRQGWGPPQDDRNRAPTQPTSR